MVEAMASGTPVIALDRGGARDIVRHEVDGLLLPQPDVHALRHALHRIASERWAHVVLADRAASFSRQRFVSMLRAHLLELLEGIHGPRSSAYAASMG